MFASGFLIIRVRFCSGSEYFKKIRFMFGSSSVNVGFGFGSGSPSVELERRFRGVICYGLTVIVSTS